MFSLKLGYVHFFWVTSESGIVGETNVFLHWYESLVNLDVMKLLLTFLSSIFLCSIGCSDRKGIIKSENGEEFELAGLYRTRTTNDRFNADNYVDLFFREDGVVESKQWTWEATEDSVTYPVLKEHTGKWAKNPKGSLGYHRP